MAQEIKLPLQKGIFDLDSFESVTLYKEVPFTPVESVPDALAKLGNDTQKLVSILNEGLMAEARRVARLEVSDWRTLNEEGVPNGPFKGTIAEQKQVNALVLTLAKTVFGYDNDAPLEAKKAAKTSAMDMIKSTPAIKAGLQKSAALAAEAEAKAGSTSTGEATS